MTSGDRGVKIPLPFDEALSGFLAVNPKAIPKPKVAVTAAKKAMAKKKAAKKAAKKK